jgi:EAL domain-containing protein (putative c-di-GMP-specific phosphodiesterase class I)/FixJ family two-component response regulator
MAGSTETTEAAEETGKVLLVDDDPTMLAILRHELAGFGRTNLQSCGSAREALAIVEAQADVFSLVFCDLKMPDMDAVELVRELARAGYGGELVLVSDEDQRILETVRILASAHGVHVLGVLNRPINSEQMGKVLAAAPRRAHQPRALRKKFGADELRAGIESGQLENHYQPKVELAGARVVGMETLVRWAHPAHGLVYPDQFIGTAEERGLIGRLTSCVLSGALQQLRLWRDAGIDLRVAVNVSVEDLVALDFPDVVARLAIELDVPPSSLVLEVTESRLMKHPLAALEILTRLRLKGVGLSIDDFGTGHSSLTQLRDIPFDELKVDQGFVHGAHRDGSRRAILEASLGMARQLGIKSVAEGVEDLDDWNFLRTCGCDMAQGYFIARPMAAAAVPGWLAEWESRRPALTNTD